MIERKEKEKSQAEQEKKRLMNLKKQEIQDRLKHIQTVSGSKSKFTFPLHPHLPTSLPGVAPQPSHHLQPRKDFNNCPHSTGSM